MTSGNPYTQYDLAEMIAKYWVDKEICSKCAKIMTPIRRFFISAWITGRYYKCPNCGKVLEH